MSDYRAIIRWTCQGPNFLRGQYSREHTWHFDGGLTIPASPSPHVVPAPWSNPAHLDPEEAFIASIASSHMLTFLWLAGRAGFQAGSYEDEAIGTMTKNEKGTPWVSLVILRPKIVWTGAKLPDAATLENLHHVAHEQCFIAASVKTEIRVES